MASRRLLVEPSVLWPDFRYIGGRSVAGGVVIVFAGLCSPKVAVIIESTVVMTIGATVGADDHSMSSDTRVLGSLFHNLSLILPRAFPQRFHI